MDLKNSKSAGILVGLVAICGVTAAALMHKTSPSADAAPLVPPGYSATAQTSVVNDSAATQTSSAADDGYYPSSQRPLYVRQPDPVAVPNPENQYAASPAYPGERYRTRTVYEQRPVYRHGRSKEHSVEIVAGTAGVGAAIGAIAGGGKGAAIGAVSGAGAGFAYDRLTHNH